MHTARGAAGHSRRTVQRRARASPQRTQARARARRSVPSVYPSGQCAPASVPIRSTRLRRSGVAGDSTHSKRPERHSTSSDRTNPSRTTNRSTGIASSTSFATTTPTMRSGSRSSQRTRSSRCGTAPARVSRWRSRRSALTSRMRYRAGSDCSTSSSASIAAAIAPDPAPSSSTSPPPSDCSTSAHCAATQRLNTGATSGAVMKSPDAPNLRAPAL